eukprot:gene3644-13723_t
MFSAGPYDIVHVRSPPSSPKAPELQDLKEINLREEASGLLEVEYLSKSVPLVVGGEWPVHGVLYGPCKRPLVCLPTQLRWNSPCINVFYLVDTGAPSCELSPAAFSALSADTVPPRATRATINGVHCHVHLCARDGNHPDIPVLGADFLTMMCAVLTVNYKLSTVSLCPTMMTSQDDQQIALWQNEYFDLRDENAELKTQVLEKNEQIAQLRREVNAANKKLVKLQQIISPGLYLASK